jgi:hypothetical protein
MQVEHEYPHGLLTLHFWLCRPERAGDVQQEHQGFEWVSAAGLAKQRFPEANRTVLEILTTGQHRATPQAGGDGVRQTNSSKIHGRERNS